MGLYCTSKNKQKMSNSRTWYRYLMNTLFSNVLISVDTETLAKIMLVLILNTRTTLAVRTNMFWSKIDIWNANCPRETAFISARKDVVLVKVSKLLRQNMSRPEGDSNPPTFGFMLNVLIIWAIRARPLLAHVFEYWLWRYRYFWCKLLTVRGQQHLFSTHERMSLYKCQSFWNRKFIDLRGTNMFR